MTSADPPPAAPSRSRPAWWRIALGVAVTAATVWFLARTVPPAEFVAALRSARPAPIAWGVLAILATGFVKAWRWQLIFHPPTARPRLAAAFWAVMLNQMVNTVVIGRFGELARIYYISRDGRVGKAQALGAIVVEKSLEMLFTVLTVALLAPWVALPAALGNPTATLAVSTAGLLGALYLFSFQADWIVAFVQRLTEPLPTALGRRIVGVTRAGLQGLAGLRDRRAAAAQMGLSALTAVLYILTPWLLFAAFDLPFTVIDAALLHLWTSLATAIPSTPGRIGVWEGVVIALLTQLAPDLAPSLLLSYAVVFHLVVLVPPLALGAVAAARSDWRRQAAASASP